MLWFDTNRVLTNTIQENLVTKIIELEMLLFFLVSIGYGYIITLLSIFFFQTWWKV